MSLLASFINHGTLVFILKRFNEGYAGREKPDKGNGISQGGHSLHFTQLKYLYHAFGSNMPSSKCLSTNVNNKTYQLAKIMDR